MKLQDYLTNNGIDIDKLFVPYFQQIPANISDEFVGTIDQDQISLHIHERYGRFGNNVYQILHAIVVAKYLKIGTICCGFKTIKSHANLAIIDDISMQFEVAQPVSSIGISTTLFYPAGFEICFHSLDYCAVKSVAEKLGRLFLMDRAAQTNFKLKKVAMHFRSGDVFSQTGNVHPFYVQPPLSYYVLALDHLCRTLTNFEIYVVFEDQKNPTISGFTEIIENRNIPYSLQSSSLEEDACLMASAHTIVSSFSTLCEAIALMSENIRRWYAFRTATAHGKGMEPFLPFKFCEILQGDNVEIFVAEDQDGQYPLPGTWKSSIDQIETMKNYPISSLRLQTVPYLNRSV